MSDVVFLSRLLLDARARRVRSEIASSYEMHRTLARAFVAGAATPSDEAAMLADARVLFRVDGIVDARHVVVLVQSRRSPVWEDLSSFPGYFAARPQVRTLELRLPEGVRLAFRLRANPTVKRDGKRRGLYREEEQRAWLARKGDQHGFRIERAAATCESRAARSQRHGDLAEHLAVRFDGVLVVEDGVRLAAAVAGGVGAAKGFGFGLLSLARAV